MLLFSMSTRQRSGALCSATLFPPLTTRSTGTCHGYPSCSRYRFHRGFGDPSMTTPRTGLRKPARDPSRFYRDYDAVALVRSGQPAVRARVRAAVATHRVIALVARRFFCLLLLLASPLGHPPRLSGEPYVAGSMVTLRFRLRAAVRFDANAFSSLLSMLSTVGWVQEMCQ